MTDRHQLSLFVAAQTDPLPPNEPDPGYDWQTSPHPCMPAFRALGLRPAVFYYCRRELAAGRPLPVKVTAEQLAYILRWPL